MCPKEFFFGDGSNCQHVVIQLMSIFSPLKSLFARVQIASCQVEISVTGKATAGTKGDKVGWDTGDSDFF